MSAAAVVLGGLLGLVGAIWHLAVTYVRSRRVVRGQQAWLLLPLSLLGPVGAIAASAALGRQAVWVGAAVLVIGHRIALWILHGRLTAPPGAAQEREVRS
jgi:hypothetical protein